MKVSLKRFAARTISFCPTAPSPSVSTILIAAPTCCTQRFIVSAASSRRPAPGSANFSRSSATTRSSASPSSAACTSASVTDSSASASSSAKIASVEVLQPRLLQQLVRVRRPLELGGRQRAVGVGVEQPEDRRRRLLRLRDQLRALRRLAVRPGAERREDSHADSAASASCSETPLLLSASITPMSSSWIGFIAAALEGGPPPMPPSAPMRAPRSSSAPPPAPPQPRSRPARRKRKDIAAQHVASAPAAAVNCPTRCGAPRSYKRRGEIRSRLLATARFRRPKRTVGPPHHAHESPVCSRTAPPASSASVGIAAVCTRQKVAPPMRRSGISASSRAAR